ncbi:hypothetical protein FMIA91_05280 [Fidelibacter multiformis]
MGERRNKYASIVKYKGFIWGLSNHTLIYMFSNYPLIQQMSNEADKWTF